MKFIPVLAMAALTFGACSEKRAGISHYPQAPNDSTVYTVNGVTVHDPYRPLENDTAEATLQWVAEENALTEQYLSRIPYRDDFRKRLNTLNRYKKEGMPSKESDGRYYFSANDGTANQSIIYRRSSLNDEPEVFLDPNKLSDDGTVALTGLFLSPDGKYAAYTISRSGSDWTEIYLMDTESKQLLDDHIVWAKFTGAAWLGDGFMYSAYDAPEAGKEFSNANTGHNIYYHRIGTPQRDRKSVV